MLLKQTHQQYFLVLILMLRPPQHNRGHALFATSECFIAICIVSAHFCKYAPCEHFATWQIHSLKKTKKNKYSLILLTMKL